MTTPKTLSLPRIELRRKSSTAPARSSAFTLIELLTVIAIIGILAGILIPVTGKVRETAYKSRCAGNLRQIALGTISYANENKSLLPARANSSDGAHAFNSAAGSAWEGLRPYVGNASKDTLMFCPGPLREWRNAESYNYTFSGRYITYAFFGNLALDAGVRTEFDLASISVSRLDKTPPRMALWTCFTCRTADGRYHSHGDADLAAGSPEAMKGQNAAAADGSVRWIKGADLMIYSTATLPTYGPKKTLSAR